MVNRVLDVEIGYTRTQREYNEHFKEKDSIADAVALELNVYPLRRAGFLVQPFYKREDRNAAGGQASLVTVVEDDGGFISDLAGLALRGLGGRDGDHWNTVNLLYGREVRDYTTENPADMGHIGRVDTIARYGLAYDRGLGPSWQLAIGVHHWKDDVSYPDGRSTPYQKTVVAATVVYRFRRPH